MTGLTLNVVTDEGAPYVGITVDGLDTTTPSAITIERTTDGRRWSYVRGAFGARVVTSTYIRDHEAPVNVETLYRLTVDGPTIPDTLSDLVTIPSSLGWIHDPMDPRTALPIGFTKDVASLTVVYGSASEAVRDQAVDYAFVSNSDLPVASVGIRMRASKVPISIVTRIEDSALLLELIERAGVLVIRGLPPWSPLDPSSTVTIGSINQKVIARKWHTWDAVLTQVTPPSPAISVPSLKWSDVMGLWPGATFQQMMSSRPGAKWLDWMKDPS